MLRSTIKKEPTCKCGAAIEVVYKHTHGHREEVVALDSKIRTKAPNSLLRDKIRRQLRLPEFHKPLPFNEQLEERKIVKYVDPPTNVATASGTERLILTRRQDLLAAARRSRLTRALGQPVILTLRCIRP